MVEKFPSHIRLDTYANHMSPILQHEIKRRFYNVKDQQRHKYGNHYGKFLLRNEPTYNLLSNGRIDEIKRGNKKRATHICNKKFQVRLIISGEPFN